MQLKVQDIISDAMGLIGSTAVDETPTPSEFNLGLRTLNVMIDSWSANRVVIRGTVDESFPLVAGKSTYTIGQSGADLTSSKPIKIIYAFIRYSNNIDIPLEIRDKKEIYSYSDSSYTEALPEVLAYDPGLAQQANNIGKIILYPIPDAINSYTLFITSDKYLTEFVSVSDPITFDSAYYEALIYNLATRLFRHYHQNTGAQIPIDLVLVAKSSLSAIYRYSGETFTMSTDLPKMNNSPKSNNAYNIMIDR